jgi:hypothetical protein
VKRVKKSEHQYQTEEKFIELEYLRWYETGPLTDDDDDAEIPGDMYELGVMLAYGLGLAGKEAIPRPYLALLLPECAGG